ncbi:hypothetical protein CF328_g5927, partial [Tilletia controversa]
DSYMFVTSDLVQACFGLRRNLKQLVLALLLRLGTFHYLQDRWPRRPSMLALQR